MSAATTTKVTYMPLAREFEELFQEHSQLLYRTAHSLLDNPADAEDVLQTIFVRLLRKGLPAGFQKNPKGYLYRASVNAALDTIRARKRHENTDGVLFKTSTSLPLRSSTIDWPRLSRRWSRKPLRFSS
jgi:RNA polymerase sigma factor (sigma-70 family)